MQTRERDKKRTDFDQCGRISKRGRPQNYCPDYWSERSFEDVLADLANLSVEDFENLVLELLASGHETGAYTVRSMKYRKSSNIYMAGDPDEETTFKDTNGTLWNLEEKLGSGNSGDVYRAFSNETERAIKLVRFTENLTATRRMISRLLREVVIHSHLIKADPSMTSSALLFESIVIPKTPIYPYIGAIMPLGGLSLESVLGTKRGLGLSLRSIWIITNGILAAIAHIHANGIAHGDLKPGNILISSHCNNKSNNNVSEIRVEQCNDDRQWIFHENALMRHQRKWRTKLPYFKYTTDSAKKIIDIGGKNADFDVKIIDFGASVSVSKFKDEQHICGSYYLKPPEDVFLTAVASEVYKRDIWALGLMVLNLWIGHPYIPYKSKVNLIPLMAKLTSSETQMRTEARAKARDGIMDNKKKQDLVDYIDGNVDYLADESVLSLSQCFNGGRSLRNGVFQLYDFIKICLNPSQGDRCTAADLLHHRFITDIPSDIKTSDYGGGSVVGVVGVGGGGVQPGGARDSSTTAKKENGGAHHRRRISKRRQKTKVLG